MLDLLDNINPDVEVLERSFKLSAISNRMLSQVLENNNNKSKIEKNRFSEKILPSEKSSF